MIFVSYECKRTQNVLGLSKWNTITKDHLLNPGSYPYIICMYVDINILNDMW